MRGVALGLLEGFGFRDDFIFSSIGSRVKDPYKELLKEARERNPLNGAEVLSGFKKYMEPLMRPKI